MSPNDPRHGSYAGAIRHWRDKELLCEPCRLAATRAKKSRELLRLAGRPPMLPLGDAAHKILVEAPFRDLAESTGITSHRLAQYRRTGPTQQVHHATRQKILAYRRPWTAVGVQRRLRALAVDGWSLKAVAEATGVNIGSLSRLRRNPDLKFVKRHVAVAVTEFFNAHAYTRAPEGRSSIETRSEALRRGWLPAAAWEDIDDPNECPAPAAGPGRPGRPEVRTAHVENFEWLIAQGESPEHAAQRLGVMVETIAEYRRRLEAEAS